MRTGYQNQEQIHSKGLQPLEAGSIPKISAAQYPTSILIPSVGDFNILRNNSSKTPTEERAVQQNIHQETMIQKFIFLMMSPSSNATDIYLSGLRSRVVTKNQPSLQHHQINYQKVMIAECTCYCALLYVLLYVLQYGAGCVYCV